ncbi:hypothetical protein ACLMJK_003763 [Lecanora helva]
MTLAGWLETFALFSIVSSLAIQPQLKPPLSSRSIAPDPTSSVWNIGGTGFSLMNSLCSQASNDTALSKRVCDSVNLPLPDLATAKKPVYTCDDQKKSLKANDCREAYSQLPDLDRNGFTFGNRTSGQKWDVPLPFRYPSSFKLEIVDGIIVDSRTDNAQCVIEIDQTETGTTVDDRASGVAIAKVAWELILKCADSQGSGGVATGVGKNGRLSLSIKPYKPQVECDDPDSVPTRFGPMGACQQALNKMQVSTFPQVFGKSGASEVQVSLPMTIPDDAGKCSISVDIKGPPVFTKWYDIWADAIAVTGICVIRGKWGISSNQGKAERSFHVRN